jgi:glycosyltransferase involved in cell wall biosynthesis
MSSVAVVIPCFELGSYLPEAVASVGAQTRAPDELVIVDDGSTDRVTLDALDGCRADGALVLRTDHRGASAARNHGIAATSTEYVVCLDADDVLCPSFLERTVEALDAAPEAGIAATNVEFFGDHSGVWRPPEHSLVKMLAQNCVPSASLFRAACWRDVGGYGELPACQDWDFFLSIVERGWRWVVVPEVLYRYRQRRGSISRRREANRSAVVRRVVERHGGSYEARWADVVVEMDSEIARLRAQVRALEDGKEPRPASGPQRSSVGSPPAIAAARALVDRTVPGRASLIIVGLGPQVDLGRRIRGLAESFGDGPDYREPGTSSEALALVDELRSRGAEFLLIRTRGPAGPGYARELARLLGDRHPVAGESGGDVVFDLTDYRTFSVVVCTHGRADLVVDALESVLAQDYPVGRYELIVVDNGSGDDGTQKLLTDLMRRAPVPSHLVREERNGLSFARNRGVQEARHEWVAFLDDDAVAEHDWLRSLNAVANERHALVVGGRVEKSFPPGTTPPRWFEPQYVKHFFGVNYHDRGRHERAFRIRYPLYLTGANIAYARRLFDEFGGFDTRLGRDARTLRAAEETYFNLILERDDVPIWYSDAACVHHRIGPDRLSRRHILRKAYWSGRSNACMHTMFFGRRAARRWGAGALRDAGKLLREAARAPQDGESFARLARALHNTTFVAEAYRLSLARSTDEPEPGTVRQRRWGPKDWRAEVERWPDGSEKFEALYELHLATGDEGAARAALERLEYVPRPIRAGRGLDELWGPLRRLEYERLVARVRAACERALPTGARVVVVSRGDDALLELGGDRHTEHFPQSPGGGYAGHYPENGEVAVAQLEELRGRGARYLALPATSLWWLDHYTELRDHLEHSCELVVDDRDVCAIYELRPTRAKAVPRTEGGVCVEA